MRSLAAVAPTRVLPSCTKQQQLTSTRHRRVTARCVSSDDEDRRRRSVATTSSRAIIATSILATSPAAASSIDDIAAASLSLQGDGIEAGDAAIVAGAAAAGVALIAGVANAISRSANIGTNGNASRKATSIPNATPNLRTKGASDDSRRRNYLIAPPPLFPLVPAFARQTYRYDTAPSRK